MAFFAVMHVDSVLFGRAALDLSINFYIAAAGLYEAGFRLFFAPYYFLAVVALFAHFACAASWHAHIGSRMARSLVLDIPCGVGVAMSLLIVLSLACALHPVDIPARYKAIYAL